VVSRCAQGGEVSLCVIHHDVCIRATESEGINRSSPQTRFWQPLDLSDEL
jgi:hypothetical protein